MKRHGLRSALASAALALAACASQPPVPDWQINAHGAAQKAIAAYLSGDARVEQLEWERSRAEIARTGRPELLARLELLRCAAQLASLVLQACDRFEALRPDAAAPEQAYADYLAGRLPPAHAALLPPAQRKLAATGDARALADIADPLSRLVAAGVLLRTGRASPALITLASDTASAQGWRRPLLAWLLLQLQRAEAAGDAEAAAALHRRITIVGQGAALR